MCDQSQNYPLKNYHRALAKTQVDANQAGALYSDAVFVREGSQIMPNLTWDVYGRVVGRAGVKNATYGSKECGVFTAEYRMNVETANRPYIAHVDIDESFDNLRLGRDVKDLGLSQQLSCAVPKPARSVRGSIHKRRYN